MTNRVKQGFRRRAALKAGAIHPAAWLCIRVKFIRRRRRGLPGAFLLVLPGRHRIRGEPARSGAAKNSYVKSEWPADTEYLAMAALMFGKNMPITVHVLHQGLSVLIHCDAVCIAPVLPCAGAFFSAVGSDNEKGHTRRPFSREMNQCGISETSLTSVLLICCLTPFASV